MRFTSVGCLVPDPLDLPALRSAAREALGRANAASEGPWESWDDWMHEYTIPSVMRRIRQLDAGDEPHAGHIGTVVGPREAEVAVTDAAVDDPEVAQLQANARFIACARSDVPILAAAVLSLADEVDARRFALQHVSISLTVQLAACREEYRQAHERAATADAEVERLRAENERLIGLATAVAATRGWSYCYLCGWRIDNADLTQHHADCGSGNA